MAQGGFEEPQKLGDVSRIGEYRALRGPGAAKFSCLENLEETHSQP